MNYKNVLDKKKRNEIVKKVMKELKITIDDLKVFVPFDEIQEPLKKVILNSIKKIK